MKTHLNIYINDLINKYNLDSLEVSSNPRELIIMLLTTIKHCSIADIKLDLITITHDDLTVLEDMIKKIAIDKIPPQYVTNTAYIYGNEFFVDNRVLIPRQDTETLIEYAIDKIKKENYSSVLDICTGSGVIGISIAVLSDAKDVTLTDISLDALTVAKKNIELLNVENKCALLQSNMFEMLYKTNNKYDIIVSNPPYLTKEEMVEISEYVQKEPKNALYGNKDGLHFYKIIYENAKNFLNNNGCIMVEIGYTQAKDVLDIIHSHKEYTDISVVQDINNKDRVIICHFQKK